MEYWVLKIGGVGKVKGDNLLVINISDPSALKIVGSLDTPAEALRVVVKDGYVYVADTYSVIVLK